VLLIFCNPGIEPTTSDLRLSVKCLWRSHAFTCQHTVTNCAIRMIRGGTKPLAKKTRDFMYMSDINPRRWKFVRTLKSTIGREALSNRLDTPNEMSFDWFRTDFSDNTIQINLNLVCDKLAIWYWSFIFTICILRFDLIQINCCTFWFFDELILTWSIVNLWYHGFKICK